MKTKLIPLRMKLPIKSTLACFAAFVIGGCASTTTAPSTPPAATLRIQEWTAAYYGSAAAGKGTLYTMASGIISLFPVLVPEAWEVRR